MMTFFRKPNKSQNIKGRKLTMNQLLTDAHIVLRTLKNNLGDYFGFSVFDNFQIFKKYQEFCKVWDSIGRPKLYFVTMDIKKCYDSIDTKKLLEFLKKTSLLEEEYLICRYGALFRNKNRMSKKEKAFALSSYFNYKERVTAIKLEEMYDLRSHFGDIIKDPRKAIFFDLIQRRVVHKHKF